MQLLQPISTPSYIVTINQCAKMGKKADTQESISPEDQLNFKFCTIRRTLKESQSNTRFAHIDLLLGCSNRPYKSIIGLPYEFYSPYLPSLFLYKLHIEYRIVLNTLL